ncbi:heavy metal-associated isoprenylated plant protein 47-like isoform X2 [Herrania umbratica]|uniref:Heavy metal-associated isoprenylated plant protein 47-like isoform X2 n=1 Tax=Herrania umbratica TaxID=108875 RepID=A0A6J1ANE3_9ROSI|nr:heavy metal-associated isoprenylated plant protein 47-like isoform X2 [Herrania umbratica]
MKQKIVISANMGCDKCRVKALQVAATTNGVVSVAVEGADKDKLVVKGDGVDSVELIRSLRKKVRAATLLSVEEEKEKAQKEETGKGKDEKEEVPTPIQSWHPYPPYELIIYEGHPSICPLFVW